MWQKLWNRELKQKPPKDETPTQKKKRQAAARKEARKRPFEEKESYRWIEALTTVENLVSKHTRVVHTFDREGDITEVFDKIRQLQHTGVLVRAAHNRSLETEQRASLVKARSTTCQSGTGNRITQDEQAFCPESQAICTILSRESPHPLSF